MKYLKKHLSLALALVLCLSLAACGKSSEDYVESNEDYGDDGDPTMVDCGTIEVDQDGAGQYFAISTIHTDVVYDFTLVGGDVIYWGGEYDYYQKIE